MESNEELKAQSINLVPVFQFLETEIQRWHAEYPQDGGLAILTGKVPLRDVIKFLIESADEFVVMVGGMVGTTSDVQNIVLNLLNKLYDTIIIGILPIWIKPFSSLIKYVIVDILLSNLIDYLINQYATGARVAMTTQHGQVVHMLQWKAQ
jgi:hypothetical protein